MTLVCAAMSGGVDSSVAALLSRNKSCEVHGIFVQQWQGSDDKGCAESRLDAQDAYSVAASLGIAIRTMNLCADYRELVLQPFIEQYRQGLTPNPDILCNSEIKFRRMLDAAIAAGAEHMVTGHYAGVRQRGGYIELVRATDDTKDQTYFLYRLTQQQLRLVYFPLHSMVKSEVRARARDAGLVTCDKKDSTGICFVGEKQLRSFLGNWIEPAVGEIYTPEGELLGQHEGAWFYTIGQRRGLGIGGVPGSRGDAWYVCGKDVTTNKIYVVPGHNHALLYTNSLRLHDLHWIAQPPPEEVLQQCSCRIRHGGALTPCRLEPDGTEATVHFARAQRATAPGQSVVFYHNEVCLGGAIISLGKHGCALT